MLRYFNVFGPRQDPTSQYAAVVPLFITAIAAGEPITIFDDGGQSRDFTYVDNVIAANLLAADAEGASGRIFNISAGMPATVNELADTIGALLGKPVERRYLPARAGDLRDSWADVSEARRVLGFEPAVSLDDGLRRTIESLTLGKGGLCAMSHAFGSLDELGDGYGFRKIRKPLGVTAFGVNAVVYPPGYPGFEHYHDTQDELYFVHAGTARVEVGGEERVLGPGGLVHVESTTPRKVSNASATRISSCSSLAARAATSSATGTWSTRPTSRGAPRSAAVDQGRAGQSPAPTKSSLPCPLRRSGVRGRSRALPGREARRGSRRGAQKEGARGGTMGSPTCYPCMVRKALKLGFRLPVTVSRPDCQPDGPGSSRIRNQRNRSIRGWKRA